MGGVVQFPLTSRHDELTLHDPEENALVGSRHDDQRRRRLSVVKDVDDDGDGGGGGGLAA
jgi:hypothetical protein